MRLIDRISSFLGIRKPVQAETRQPGRPAAQRSFVMAEASRSFNDWSIDARSVNSDIRRQNRLMRRRARDFVKNDPYARKFIKICEKNIVGPDGFIFRNKAGQYRQDGDRLRFVEDKVINRAIEEAFWKWQNKRFCTLTGDISFRQLCGILVKTVKGDGEIFIRHLKGRRYNKFGYTLQIIDADYLDEDKNETLSNGNTIMMGIEYTPERVVVAYYFTKSRGAEDDIYRTGNIVNDKYRVPANEIIHLFQRDSINQARGVTAFATAAYRLRMLNGFENASLDNARTAACTTGILKRTPDSTGEFSGEEQDSDGNIVRDLAPNELFVVPEGYDFQSYDPKFPSDQHGPFTKTVLRGASSGLDVAYHTLASDYENVNYTSSRTALLDERDTWKADQAWFIESFLEPVYREWLYMAAISGQLRGVNPSQIDIYDRPLFIGRRWQWVDPQNEVAASEKALQNNLTSLTRELAERGLDLEEILEERKEEIELIKKFGLSDNQKAEYIMPQNGNGKGVKHL